MGWGGVFGRVKGKKEKKHKGCMILMKRSFLLNQFEAGQGLGMRGRRWGGGGEGKMYGLQQRSKRTTQVDNTSGSDQDGGVHLFPPLA